MHDREKKTGNIRSKDARNIPAFAITHGDYLERVRKAFREHAGDRPGAAKLIAAELECSDKTTKSWLDGKTAPSGILCSRAMAKIPAYAALKRKLAAQESALDPRMQETIQELHRMTVEMSNGGAR